MNTNINTNLSNSRSAILLDCVFLCLLSLFCSFFYIWDLGFYSDDWNYLKNFALSKDKSIWGLYQAFVDPNTVMRPGQKLYQATMYWFFELDPIGHHFANSIVLSLGAVFFYLLLRELGESRLLALTISLVFIFLPHYSTARYWHASIQTLAITLYFASLYADLRAISSKETALWTWKTISIACLLASTLTYEVVIPLFILNPLVLFLKHQYFRSFKLDAVLIKKRLIALTALHYFALFAIVVFKLSTTTRLGVFDAGAQLIWFGRLLALAFVASYGDYGLGLPATFFNFFSSQISWLSVIAGISLALATYAYIRSVAAKSTKSFTERGALLRRVIAGLVIFCLGYAMFIAGRNAVITPTGMNNRIAIAAAVGVAISFVGAVAWACSFIKSGRGREVLFSFLTVCLVTSGFLINFGLSNYWRESDGEQQRILKGLHDRLPELPARHTVILDGICPYLGPAPVFEAPWDLAGAVALIYRDETLRADVVTPTLEVSEAAIQTKIYGEATHYYFDEGITVYNHKLRQTFELPSASAARQYFGEIYPDKGKSCPLSRPGYGEPVLGGILDLLLNFRFGTVCDTLGGEDGGRANLASMICELLRVVGEKSK